MEVMVCVALGACVILALSCAWACVHLIRANSREVGRVIAQTDERVKVFMRYAEKACDRWMAVTTPNNFAAMREQSGVIEGAQSSTKPHYLDEAKIADELDAKKRAADASILSEQRVRSALREEINASSHGTIPISTAMDFERRNGAP